jgi:hypothetical protein
MDLDARTDSRNSRISGIKLFFMREQTHLVIKRTTAILLLDPGCAVATLFKSALDMTQHLLLHYFSQGP